MTQGHVIIFQNPLSYFIPGVRCFHLLLAMLPELLIERRVRQQPGNGLGQPGNVAKRDQQAILLIINHAWDTTGPCADDWFTVCPRFQEHNAKRIRSGGE